MASSCEPPQSPESRQPPGTPKQGKQRRATAMSTLEPVAPTLLCIRMARRGRCQQQKPDLAAALAPRGRQAPSPLKTLDASTERVYSYYLCERTCAPMQQTFLQMAAQVDRSAAAPLYSQLTWLLRKAILQGAIQPGQALPPQGKLAASWDVSSITVRRVIRDLADQGYLHIHQGRGTFVVDNPPPPPPAAAPAAAPVGRDRTEAKRVACIISNLRLAYPFFARILDGVRGKLGPGALLHLIELPEATQGAAAPADDLDLRDLDGLLLFSPVDLALVLRCQRQAVPYVLVHNDLADGISHCVTVDFAAGVLEIVAHLAAKGRKRIALATAGAERYSAGRTTEAWRMALAHEGLAHDESLLLHAAYGEEDGYRAAAQLLGRTRPPDALICASDHMAKGALMAAGESGIQVPADLALVGMGDLLRPREVSPELTTLDTRSEEMGRLAAATLQRLAKGEERVPAHQSVRPRLIVRQSA